MTVTSLSTSEYHPNYKGYIDQVPEDLNLIDALTMGLQDAQAFYLGLDESRHNYRYEEGKWTPKELLQHIIDAERVFNYRAMRFARQDQTPIPGFEQDDYIDTQRIAKRSMQSLVDEFTVIRKGTLQFFKNLDKDELLAEGTASGFKMSTRAAGFLNVGHEIHHRRVIEERYL